MKKRTFTPAEEIIILEKCNKIPDKPDINAEYSGNIYQKQWLQLRSAFIHHNMITFSTMMGGWIFNKKQQRYIYKTYVSQTLTISMRSGKIIVYKSTMTVGRKVYKKGIRNITYSSKDNMSLQPDEINVLNNWIDKYNIPLDKVIDDNLYLSVRNYLYPAYKDTALLKYENIIPVELRPILAKTKLRELCFYLFKNYSKNNLKYCHDVVNNNVTFKQIDRQNYIIKDYATEYTISDGVMNNKISCIKNGKHMFDTMNAIITLKSLNIFNDKDIMEVACKNGIKICRTIEDNFHEYHKEKKRRIRRNLNNLDLKRDFLQNVSYTCRKKWLYGDTRDWDILSDTVDMWDFIGRPKVKSIPLNELHDEYTRLYKKLKTQDFPILPSFETIENEKYIIKPVESYYEAIDWGETMHNCVASYAHRAKTNNIIIGGVLDKQNNNILANFSITPHDKHMEQFYGAYNQYVPADMYDDVIDILHKNDILNRHHNPVHYRVEENYV